VNKKDLKRENMDKIQDTLKAVAPCAMPDRHAKAMEIMRRHDHRLAHEVQSPANVVPYILQFWTGKLGVVIVQLWQDGGADFYTPTTGNTWESVELVLERV
jgi:hypothetical protein